MATKKELAEIAIRLFNNIDQAEQFNVYELFYHCDKKFLLDLISRLKAEVVYNAEIDMYRSRFDRNVGVDKDELEEILATAERLLSKSK